MSAYGTLTRPARSSTLPPTVWPHPHDPHTTVTTFHVDPTTLAAADGLDTHHPGLFAHLHAIFADEVDRGLTYPQEDMRDPDAFRAYFCAADVVIAVVAATCGAGDDDNRTSAGIAPDPRPRPRPHPHPLAEPTTGPADRAVLPVPVANGDGAGDGVEVEIDLETARANRSWDACVVGFYYVKPNYPGRSSHICNAGFVVPPSHRGGGYGRVLARSYLYYAPRLGYEASVFNLVYVNNVASVRIWEKLGFIKAGLIPKAGRLKRTDGPGEEYVDALIFYKSF